LFNRFLDTVVRFVVLVAFPLDSLEARHSEVR
jgi:hypothetical protein